MKLRRPATIVAVIGLIAAACGGSTASPSASSGTGTSAAPTTATSQAPATVSNIVLRYCWSGEGEVTAMESIIQDWNKANPAIQVRGISGSINPEQIAAAVAGGAPPDMVITCNNLPIPGFAHDSVILPMDDLLTKIGADTSDILPASLAWVKYQDKLYGLPFLQDTWGFFWNTDAFTEVGLDPTKPPKTLTELWDMAKKLTKVNPDGSLARAGFIPDYPGKNLTELAELFGCKYYDSAAKKVTVNSAECVAWFNWYKKWHDEYDKKGALTNLIAGKGSEDEDLFYTGKIAMMVSGSWLTGAAYAPNFAPKLDYGAAPFPAIDPAQYSGGYVNGNGFAVPKGSKCLDCAVTFWAYLESKGPMVKIAIQNASVPTPVALQNDPTLNAIPNFGTFIKIANSPVAWSDPTIRDWAGISDALDSAWDTIKSGGQSPKQALDAIVNQFQPGIDANGP